MDKWFAKGLEAFRSGDYLTRLFTQPPYMVVDVGATAVVSEDIKYLHRVMKETVPTPESVYQAVKLCYSVLGNGSIFRENVKRVVRTFERCTDNKLGNNPALCGMIFNEITKCASLSIEEFAKLIPPTTSTKQQGSKDKVFIQESLAASGYTDCGSSFKKLLKSEKGFCTSGFKKVLSKLNMKLPLHQDGKTKTPDGLVKNGNFIVVNEDKYLIETGGEQNLSAKDGLAIFDVQNASTSPVLDLRKVFCFDGRLDLVMELGYLPRITEENKIMSIFDLVEYIERIE